VVGALVKGLLLAVVVAAWMHRIFPEAVSVQPQPVTPFIPDHEATQLALRATLVVMPAYLLAMTDPASYLAIIMKSVALARQSCASAARVAARELVGSTLLGGLLAIAFWFALTLFAHLWMFFLWMLLFGLLVGRKLYRISPSHYSSGFWVNSLATMIILLGQSVQDSAAGNDVYTAFAVRMGLFLAVTLYACLMLLILDRHRIARDT
jgi:hypothetical protein